MKDGKREREDVDVDFRQKGEASKRLLIRLHGCGREKMKRRKDGRLGHKD
jgi:hypothetical protein